VPQNCVKTIPYNFVRFNAGRVNSISKSAASMLSAFASLRRSGADIADPRSGTHRESDLGVQSIPGVRVLRARRICQDVAAPRRSAFGGSRRERFTTQVDPQGMNQRPFAAFWILVSAFWFQEKRPGAVTRPVFLGLSARN
jgi:hypothetical protein